MSNPFLAAGLSALPIGGCTGIPEATRAATGFALDRYLGKWFKIARRDRTFVEGLDIEQGGPCREWPQDA